MLSAAHTRIAACVWPSSCDAASATSSTAAQARCRAKAARLLPLTAPLRVTAKPVLRLRRAAHSALTYSGVDITEIAIPLMPEEPSSSCGLTLCLRFQK
ncbi:MAG: hypothetical protein M3Q47_06540 [Actinomycetota bacterium]|nr:hypothetical protein [Actinomycetota bacterium]